MTTLARMASLALLLGTALSGITAAQARPHFYEGPPLMDQWHDGYWHHGYYHGRLGWWWVAGGVWYWYDAPAYPYPAPYAPAVVVAAPVVPVAPAAPAATPAPAPAPEAASPSVAQVWYFCKEAKQYYPYVSECPGGWKTVPAQPPK